MRSHLGQIIRLYEWNGEGEDAPISSNPLAANAPPLTNPGQHNLPFHILPDAQSPHTPGGQTPGGQTPSSQITDQTPSDIQTPSKKPNKAKDFLARLKPGGNNKKGQGGAGPSNINTPAI